MASAKNKLQEFFQKHQLPLPVYNTYSYADNGSTGFKWFSTVSLYDGRSATGSFSTKVGAEQQAALAALQLLTVGRHMHRTSQSTFQPSPRIVVNEPQRSRDTNLLTQFDRLTVNESEPVRKVASTTSRTTEDVIIFDEPTALLVDLENLPKIVDELPPTLGLNIYVFVGEHHPLADKVFTRPVIRVISPSTRKDGTDTCMQVYTGMLLIQQKYERYIIATIDHYGAALIEMIENNTLGWVAKTGQLITRAKQLH